jgi:hypothetical protein
LHRRAHTVVAVVNKVLLSKERLHRSTQIAILSTPELDASDPLLATDEVVQSLVEGLQSIDDAGITMRVSAKAHARWSTYMHRITMLCLQVRARRNICHWLWTRGAKTHRGARCRFREESALCAYSGMLISVYTVACALTVCLCAPVCLEKQMLDYS